MNLSPAPRIKACDSCRCCEAACRVVFDDEATFEVCSGCAAGSARPAAVTALQLPALPIPVQVPRRL